MLPQILKSEDTDVLSEVVEDESTWTDATPNAENQVEDISVEFCNDDPTIMSFSNSQMASSTTSTMQYKSTAMMVELCQDNLVFVASRWCRLRS